MPLLESCTDYTWTPRSASEVAAGGDDIPAAQRMRPGSDGNLGRIEAIDLMTGKVVWAHRQRPPVASSLLVTAGGLLFGGSEDRSFSAYDAANGNLLWQGNLNAPPSSSPVTYTVGDQQYVAVVAGGGGAFDTGPLALAPEIKNPAGGTTLWFSNCQPIKLPAYYVDSILIRACSIAKRQGGCAWRVHFQVATSPAVALRPKIFSSTMRTQARTIKRSAVLKARKQRRLC